MVHHLSACRSILLVQLRTTYPTVAYYQRPLIICLVRLKLTAGRYACANQRTIFLFAPNRIAFVAISLTGAHQADITPLASFVFFALCHLCVRLPDCATCVCTR
jgi:hypothetical protein